MSADPTAAPLLFISHRHADQSIADVVRNFVTDRSGGRIRVFQSSAAQADNPRVGRELQRELKESLWAAGVVILVYTSPDEDWSYCMWECGVATHPQSPETKILVLQCGGRAPSVYSDAVRIDATRESDVEKFVNEFLTATDFFPNHAEAVAPGFSPNGEQVKHATGQLYAALTEVVPRAADDGEDWPTVPFMRLQLSYTEVDTIRQLDAVEGRRAVRDALRVREIGNEAKSLFGLGRVEELAPFSRLIDAWAQGRADDPDDWADELVEQIRIGSHWRLPRFRWQLMSSVNDSDRAKYAPVLSRVRSVPRLRCHHFDVYFSKFDTNDDGALRIGFANERQTDTV